MTGSTYLRPHVVVLHRWRDSYAHYERYLSHERAAVSYITTEVGVAGVPAGAAEIAIVDATDDVEQADRQIRKLAQRHGPPDAIVALREDDLLPAAVLAQRWGCRGRTPDELTPMRDKLVMARAVATAGIATPATVPAPDPKAILDHGARHGWPVVVKPRLGSSSQGVRFVAGPEDIGDDFGRWQLVVQARNDNPIYHVDGVFDGTRLGPWRASRYLDTCVGFRDGRPLGSVETDDPVVLQAIGSFTTSVLRALTSKPTAFHLELFVGWTSGGSVHCTFLEIGARVGGAEIPFNWRDVHGYDLMEAAFGIALGLTPQIPQPAAFPQTEVAGWLLVPAPAERPCRIEEVTPMLGRADGPYAEVVPQVGDILPAADAYYEHVGARYRFRGPDTASVESAVLATARQARVVGRSCADPVAGGVL